MHKLRRQLPSLNALFAVEAVARHLSFTDAASELGISQPAVSKAVKTAEGALGFKLFERGRRGLTQTENGKAFVSQVRLALNRISSAIDDASGATLKREVSTCFSSSFVSLWMLPNLAAFNQAHPDIALRLNDSYSEDIDLASWGLDFSARLGDGNWDGYDSWFLVEEELGAVASPDYMARNPDLVSLTDLAQADLIHVDEPKRKRLTWHDWFAALDHPPPVLKNSLTVSDYNSAVDAALVGQGVALGWAHLVQGRVQRGDLVWVGQNKIKTGQGIYLIAPSNTSLSDEGTLFRDWIISRFSKANDQQ